MQKQTENGSKNIQSLGEIAISSDSRFIAFVGRWFDEQRDQEHNALFLLALDQQGQALDEPRIVFSSLKPINSPVWAPDSRRVLFLSDWDNQQRQIWLMTVESREAHKLTTMPSGVDEVAWSPDGRWIAFTALAAPFMQDSEEEPEDDAQFYEQYTQLFVMPVPDTVEGRRGDVLPQRLTHDAVDYTQPSWALDSQEIGILRNKAEDRERSFLTDLWAIAPATGEARCLTNRMLEIDCYAWSPNGQSLVVVASQEEGDSGGSTQHLYLVARYGNVGDNTLLLTPELDNATLPQAFSGLGTPGPYRPVWSPDGQRIYFLVTEQQAVNVYCVEVVWRTLTRLTEHSLTYFLASLPQARSLLVAQQHPGLGWELYRLTYEGETVPLTSFHDKI